MKWIFALFILQMNVLASDSLYDIIDGLIDH